MKAETITGNNEYAVVTKNLTKKYAEIEAVSGLNLKVPYGSIYGFLGMNGAGKTTTLKMLSGLTKPTEGEIYICGEKLNFGKGKISPARFMVGFLPDVPSFYGWMNAYEFLEFAGSLYRKEKKELDQRINTILGLVGLKGCKIRISKYSRGMRQRLGIAQALINNPSLLLLDEPVSALDPVGRKEIMDIINSLSGKVTVFFSSHILADVERVCDNIMILHKGKMVLEGAIADLLSNNSGKITIITGSRESEDPKKTMAAAVSLIEKLDFIDSCQQENEHITVIAKDNHKANVVIPGLLSAAGIPIISYHQHRLSLEDIFIKAINTEAENNEEFLGVSEKGSIGKHKN